MANAMQVAGAYCTTNGVSDQGGDAFLAIRGAGGRLWLTLAVGFETGWGDTSLRVSRAVLAAIEAEARRRGEPPEGHWPEAFVAAEAAIARLPLVDVDAGALGTPMCTAVYAYVGPKAVRVAWLGDNVALLVRSGRIESMTEPHTMGHELYRRGEISRSEVRTHVFSRHLSRTPLCNRVPGRDGDLARAIEVSAHPWAWRPGDRLALVSNEIWRAHDDLELVRIVSHGSAECAAQALVKSTVARGFGVRPGDASALVVVSPSPPDEPFERFRRGG